jgi:D-3-phosphoglycerate dehydrogenase
VDKGALFNALRQKRIAGAALDVFWEEPIDPEDPFIKLDNVIVTPHLGGTLKDTLLKSIEKLNKRLAPIYEKYSAQMKTPE